MKDSLVDVLQALAACRRVVITIDGAEPARPARMLTTRIVFQDQDELRRYQRPAQAERPAKARVSLQGRNCATVRCRQRKGETMIGMLERGIVELQRREMGQTFKRKQTDAELRRRRNRKLLQSLDLSKRVN